MFDALPPAEPLLQTSFVCAADITEACGPDNAIATFSAEEDRINVPLEELPEVLTQAVLEGVTFAIRDNLEALRSAGTGISRVTAIGGGSRSRSSASTRCQYQPTSPPPWINANVAISC